MGEVVRLRRHAGNPAGSVVRTRLAAGTPVAASIFAASSRESPRLPPKINDRWDSEHPTARAKAACLPSRPEMCAASRDNPSMPPTLPPAKTECKGKLCYGEIDIPAPLTDYPGMDRGDDESGSTLYIGEWIAAFDLKPREVHKKSGVSEPYLSQLINNRKANPSQVKLKQVADALGIKVKDLYSRPPSRETLDELSRLSPDQIVRLQQRQKAG